MRRNGARKEAGGPPTSLRRLPVGSENVLLLAGDGAGANALEDRLLMLGYRISASVDPVEAMRLVLTGDFALVIVDATADIGVAPEQVADAIRQSGGDSALLIVGGSESAEHNGVERLKVPYSLSDLAVRVRATLDRRSG